MGCVWSSADLVGGGYRIKIVKQIAEGGFSQVGVQWWVRQKTSWLLYVSVRLQVLLCNDIDSSESFAVKKIAKHSRESGERILMEVFPSFFTFY